MTELDVLFNNKSDLRSASFEEIDEYVKSIGEKSFRTKQIYEWIQKRGISSYEEMNNIPKVLKEKLSDKYVIYPVEKERVQISSMDGTRKYLFKLFDNQLIESVFMKYEHGNSVCVSSQVGCRMGCKFCASTIDGVYRNLHAGEILGQIYEIEKDTNEKVSNIVIMGSGEPFDNFDNVTRFIELLTDDKGRNLSGRNITVSTCGLVPKIYEFADRGYAATLAISLHAPNDEKRKEIMPIANKYSIEEITKACKYFFEKTGRRLTFEYSLILGVNDTDKDAKELTNVLKGINCHVNLIPVNPIKERNFKQTRKEGVIAFKNKLEKNGINVTIRREMGRDIDGACGQLRRRALGK